MMPSCCNEVTSYLHLTKADMPILIAVFIILIVLIAVIWSRQLAFERAEYIRTFMLPSGLLDKLNSQRPELEAKDHQLIARALRQFFMAHLTSGRKFVSMPSQVVDDLWHEFILYTQQYERFCQKAFGRFLHHTPAVVLGANRSNNAGIRRVWWYACLEENINPKKATRLPLLFAIDAKLKIHNGFYYVLDCKGISKLGDSSGSAIYCGGDISSTDFDGGTDGFGDSLTSDSGDAGGCGGGCGGGD
jgi:hypothetical protein